MLIRTLPVARSVLRRKAGWLVNDQLWRTRTIGERNIECDWYPVNNHTWSATLGVCQISLLMWPRHLHTFTCKCRSLSHKWRYSSCDDLNILSPVKYLSLSDKWRYSSCDLDVYILSPVNVAHCLTNGVTHHVMICTYFHL